LYHCGSDDRVDQSVDVLQDTARRSKEVSVDWMPITL
jgi:hypothetical protein